MQHDNKSHVHFSEDTDEIGHTEINLKVKSPNFIEAHVGFLQVYHKYFIVLKVPFTTVKDMPKIKDTDVPGAGVKVDKILMNKENSCYEVCLNFYAYKEKLLREKFALSASDGKDIQITIFARVLGKGKGTPMLRENVTCVGVEHVEDEDELSDWQGFK